MSSSLLLPPHSARKQAASKLTPKLGRGESTRLNNSPEMVSASVPGLYTAPRVEEGEAQIHATSELEWLSAGHRIVLIH